MELTKLPHDHGAVSCEVRSGLPGDAHFEQTAQLVKLLGDGKRLQIFLLLCHCQECVVNLSALCGLSSPAASHHLKQLKQAGLVVSRREGKEVYYTAAPTPQAKVLHDMAEALFEITCPAEESLVQGQQYDSSVGIVGQIHALLIADPARRYTIEELSSRFHMNPTTLKTEFKRVFGRPVAAYMKEYRMKLAAKMLAAKEPIATVAARVGYENQSKFSQAFRDVMGVLPKDYRKTKNLADKPESL